MREGKLKDNVWQRSVIRQIHTGFESRAGSMPVPIYIDESLGAYYALEIREGTLAAERMVFGICNQMTAAGSDVQMIQASMILPEHMEERELKALIRRADELCVDRGITFLPGWISISSDVKDLMIQATGIGEIPAFSHRAKDLTGIDPDMEILCVGDIAREGTAIIACREHNCLTKRYPDDYIREAGQIFEDADLRHAAGSLAKMADSTVCSLGEGGIFAGLWQLAAAGKVGLLIDLAAIPIRQHTIEVCEFFSLNPYMLLSGGSLLAACNNGEKIVQELREAGIKAAVIGHTTNDNNRIITYDDEIRFLEPPKQDEIYRYLKQKNTGGNHAKCNIKNAGEQQ